MNNYYTYNRKTTTVQHLLLVALILPAIFVTTEATFFIMTVRTKLLQILWDIIQMITIDMIHVGNNFVTLFLYQLPVSVAGKT